MEICSVEKCTGCFACKNICPKDAILVKCDLYGKTIPEIQKDKCVECGLCQNVCPVNKEKKFRLPKKCYAIWTKNEIDRKDCASGGVATGLGRYIIEKGGVVFGTDFIANKELELVISMGETKEDLQRLKSSKYVQASTGDSYKNTKKQLECGRMVLYVGTPCQIAGLQSYLGKEYDNLITVDLICHGTPPIKYLQEYAKKVCGNQKITKASFRGLYDYELCFYEAGRSEPVYQKPNYLDLYYHAFSKGLISRDNCYECEYAGKNRISDLTIGDFWGLKRESLQEKCEGRISVALVNTQKGKKILEACSHLFVMEERTLEEAVAGNEQLKKPSVKHEDYEQFRKVYKSGGFYKALQNTVIYKEIKNQRWEQSVPGRIVRKVLRLTGIRKY